MYHVTIKKVTKIVLADGTAKSLSTQNVQSILYSDDKLKPK